jgi:thrombospondin type 3 repeat protein
MTSRKTLSLLGTFAIALLGLALPAFADDGDTLTDADEAIYGTDPHLTDSDGDGLSDDYELFESGTNPLDPDTDGDGKNDDVDATPLHAAGAWDGGSSPSHTGASSTRPYTPSGESATDGAGVYVHSGALEVHASAGFYSDVRGTFRFGLTYNSQNTLEGYVGFGWSSILDWKVTASGADMLMVMPNGFEYMFADDGSGGWDAPDGFLGGLTVDSGVYTWELPNGVKFQFDDADDGRLGKIEDRYGNDLTIAFDVNDRATSMTDARGEQHDFTYFSVVWNETLSG